MDALERIRAIRPEASILDWSVREFRLAKAEGYRRWRETRAKFEIDYQLFGDAVAELAPAFLLPTAEEQVAAGVDVPLGGGNCPRRALVWFLKWDRSPVTTGLPNPYEPWIEIWEHGGTLSVEHAQFVDISFQERTADGLIKLGYA